MAGAVTATGARFLDTALPSAMARDFVPVRTSLCHSRAKVSVIEPPWLEGEESRIFPCRVPVAPPCQGKR